MLSLLVIEVPLKEQVSGDRDDSGRSIVDQRTASHAAKGTREDPRKAPFPGSLTRRAAGAVLKLPQCPHDRHDCEHQAAQDHERSDATLRVARVDTAWLLITHGRLASRSVMTRTPGSAE